MQKRGALSAWPNLAASDLDYKGEGVGVKWVFKSKKSILIVLAAVIVLHIIGSFGFVTRGPSGSMIYLMPIQSWNFSKAPGATYWWQRNYGFFTVSPPGTI
ncbi:MAG: hypothetical protein ABJA67_04430 [Chthonomonadales bacterium]